MVPINTEVCAGLLWGVGAVPIALVYARVSWWETAGMLVLWIVSSVGAWLLGYTDEGRWMD